MAERQRPSTKFERGYEKGRNEVILEEDVFNEMTLYKVFHALRRVMDNDMAEAAINEMQNAGILFRERR